MAAISNSSIRKAKAFPITPLAKTELHLREDNSVTHPSPDASPGKVGKTKHQLMTALGPISSSTKTEMLLLMMKGERLLKRQQGLNRPPR